MEHIKIPFLNKYGYLQISIKNYKNKDVVPLVHRLVAWEWELPNRDLLLTVNHIDGVKLNNHYSNLEWITDAENKRKA